MGSTANYNLTYPASTAHDRLWEHFQTLADDTDDALTSVAAAYPSATRPLWTKTATAATTGVTTEAVALSAPSSTYLAHTAYRLSACFLIRSTSGTGSTSFAVRDTNAAGTLRYSTGIFPIAVVSTNYHCTWFCDVANTSGSNITARVLALTQTGTTCTALINAGAGSPYVWQCIPLGLDTDFPNAVAL